MKFDFLKNIDYSKVLLFFSGGKDSIVMLDLLSKYSKIEKIIGVYLYFVPDMSYKNEIIDYYSKKYNIDIIQAPHPFHILYQQKRVYGIENNLDRKYTMQELQLGVYQKNLKIKMDIEYGSLGYKKTDSITRARQLYKFGEIDKKTNGYIRLHISQTRTFSIISKKKN
jgi:3'-phosphoadenosine 5'-phosphosulfate sulfotransferase (PAPS reductase)/FAD synthetase